MKTFVLAILLTLFPAFCFAMGEDMTEEAWDEWIKECPYGDAVLNEFGSKNYIYVDCVNFNLEKKTWDVVLNGKKKSFPIEQFEVHSMVGDLIYGSDDQIQIINPR